MKPRLSVKKKQRLTPYPETIGAWCTPEQKAKFVRNGGSEWLRKLIDKAPDKGESHVRRVV